jgi:nitrate/nitrite-specific signal transduction histidine kinase
MGDNREDLHNIYNPIRKTIEWYDITNNEIKGICEYSVKGIKVLQSSYNSNSIVSHTLDLYINQLENALKNKSKKPLESIVNRTEDNYNHIYSQLKKLWTENEIIISYNMLLEMTAAQKKNDTKSLESYISSLDSLLDMKEEKVKEIIISTMTVLN